ncbi:hypothetical protein ACIBF1_44160 [Spirillospora sp. NPDC050679]
MTATTAQTPTAREGVDVAETFAELADLTRGHRAGRVLPALRADVEAAARAHQLAVEWAGSRDLSIAAAGQILLAALTGHATRTDLI